MLRRIRTLFGRFTQPKNDRQDTASAPAAHPSRRASAPTGRPEVVKRPIPREELDPDAVKIVQRLTRYGHKAYLVGGCVRDGLLNRHPKDFDIGTSATPRQIKRVFRNCRIIGRRFRLAHIYFHGGKIIEVATFRASNDGSGKDDGDLLIRDDNEFGTTATDALRRDFTINQLFYDLSNETVIDHAHGLADLEKRLVRTIGDPAVRFREDPIRILRAIKFAARLGFTIEPTTMKAVRSCAREMPKAAPPRVLEEINRFCRGGAAVDSFRLLRETGVEQVILPEIDPFYHSARQAEPDCDPWELLGRLLARVDQRHAQGHEVRTGAIFTLLLIPAIRHELGWSADGKAASPRGLDLRALVDGILRPIAQRLRVARQEQEVCRLILLSLFRMVPSSRLRRNTRRSILRRDSYGDALWILEVLADAWGGDFAEAFDDWKNQKPELDDRDADAKETEPREEEGGRRRRRRKRGGRGRSRKRRDESGDSGDSSDPEEKPTPSDSGRGKSQARGRVSDRKNEPARKVPAGPRKHGDDSFFSALPTVPDLPDVDGEPHRYGGEQFGTPETPTRPDDAGDEAAAEAVADAPVDATGTDEERPRRRRRRRRRRRSPRAGEDDSADSAGQADEGSDSDSDPDDS